MFWGRGFQVSEVPSYRVSKFPSFQVSKFPSYRVSKFPSFQGREGGRTNERPGTDHVTSGPMRGLEKNCTRWRRQTHIQTDGHGDSMTESAQWVRFNGGKKKLCSDHPVSTFDIHLLSLYLWFIFQAKIGSVRRILLTSTL